MPCSLLGHFKDLSYSSARSAGDKGSAAPFGVAGSERSERATPNGKAEPQRRVGGATTLNEYTNKVKEP
jgi:hypothetical protein